MGRPHNPFSVQRTGPTGCRYLFAPGDSLHALMAELEANQWRMELCGPHGAGKTTLLRTIATEFDRIGRAHADTRVQEDQPRLSAFWRWKWRHDVVMVDSAELLPRRQFAALALHCKRRGMGLIVTTHTASGLLPLRMVRAGKSQFAELVQNLSGIDAAGRLERHGGNAREALAALYDEWESGAIG